MADPILSKARHALLALADNDVVNLLRLLTEPPHGKVEAPRVVRIIKCLSLVPKLRTLISTYRAIRISKTYGW